MKIGLILATVLLAGYCAVVAMLAWQQRRLLYAPDMTRPKLPPAAVVDAWQLSLPTADGLELLAWFAVAADDMQPVVLYLHGNAGNIGHRAHRFTQLSRFGWGVLLLEYRGFGGNPGTPTEAGLTADARAGYAALIGRDVAASRIVLWGESLGTGLAVRLASEAPVGAVILESPFTSIAAIASRRYPIMPVDWVLQDRFELLGRIGTVRAPVLVMSGGRDNIVPPSMSRAVFAAANQPKVFWYAPAAGHNDLAEAGAFDAVRSFVQAHWQKDRLP